MRTYVFPLANGNTVEFWYSRSVRSWVVQVKDAEGNQVGDAHYVYSKQEACVEVGYQQHMADKAVS
jgi:hypothetical protein